MCCCKLLGNSEPDEMADEDEDDADKAVGLLLFNFNTSSELAALWLFKPSSHAQSIDEKESISKLYLVISCIRARLFSINFDRFSCIGCELRFLNEFEQNLYEYSRIEIYIKISNYLRKKYNHFMHRTIHFFA